MAKTIITCAVTGAIHTPTMSDALPYRPEDIARQAIDAAHAGAAILHLHARDPETGKPSVDPAHFRAFLPAIRAETDAIVNISTGGSITMGIADR
ncbi:MAG: 3-keto-5-aminohexanoate cleavage protein, partial [Pseudomonadota bacterium]